MLSYILEKDVDCLENDILNGVIFPGTEQKVKGYRLDKPTVSATLTGAPHWVEKSDVSALFGRWGKVVNISRGTSAISSPDGEVGVFGSGWVWNNEWNVKIKCTVEKDIPPCVLAGGEVQWRPHRLLSLW